MFKIMTYILSIFPFYVYYIFLFYVFFLLFGVDKKVCLLNWFYVFWKIDFNCEQKLFKVLGLETMFLLFEKRRESLRYWTLKRSSQVWKEERVVKALDLEMISFNFWLNEGFYELVYFVCFLFIKLQFLKDKFWD